MLKLATFRGVTPKGDPLVQLFRQGDSIKKVAGTLMPSIRDWLGTYKSDKQKIALLVNALGASEYWGQNINGDIFPEPALVHDCNKHSHAAHPIDDFTGKVIPPYGAWTFKQYARPYVHHKNKDPNRAFGTVEHWCWNPRMRRVELVVVLDRDAALQNGAQHVVDRIESGEYSDVSMGCKVPYDICTICSHKSKTRHDYCKCITEFGMGVILRDGRRVGVINTYPRFFDISFVFIGADKTAKVMCKLGSGLLVPLSAIEGEYLYGAEEDTMVKAASVPVYGPPPPGFRDLIDKHRSTGVGDSTPDARTKMLMMGDLWKEKVRHANERLLQTKKEGDPSELMSAKDFLKYKGASTGAQFSSESYTSGTDLPTKHVKARGEFEDGEGRATITRLKPPPEETTNVLFGKTDAQEQTPAVTDGIMRTNADYTYDDEDPEKDAVARVLMEKEAKSRFIKELAKRWRRGSDLGGVPRLVRTKAIAHSEGRSAAKTIGKLRDVGARGKARGGVLGKAQQQVAGGLESATRATAKAQGLLTKRGAFGFTPPEVRAKTAAPQWKIGPPPMPNREQYPFVGTLNFRGLEIGVENAPGTWRTGKGWKTLMKNPYGEFLHGKAGGTDGDKLDVFVGPSRNCKNVFIVHQNFVRGPKKGQYDEDKIMLGFDTPAQAKQAYLAHYDSDKYFRSMTTMAFPLFKRAVIGGEVDGEKVASIQEAMANYHADMKLEDLFSNPDARRRERTWRDKVTGKETTVIGSGMGKEITKEKRASLPYDDESHGHIFPRSDGMKMRCTGPRRCAQCARDKKIRDAGGESPYGKEKKAQPLTPMEFLKMSFMKESDQSKWADIVKEIGPDKATGKVTELLDADEPSIPDEALDTMGCKCDLPQALATPSLMGMVLKPEEFQRIMLGSMGKSDLADSLGSAGITFKPCEGEEAPCESLSSEHFMPSLMKALMPLLKDKSYMGPVVQRRIIKVTIKKPEPAGESTEVKSPLLTKVARAYNWYRMEQLKLAAEAPEFIMTVPTLSEAVYDLRDSDVFRKEGSGFASGVALGSVPLSLMYSAHLRDQQRMGQPHGFIKRTIAQHPWLTSIGTAAALRSALGSRLGQLVTRDVKKGLGEVWHGKPVP